MACFADSHVPWRRQPLCDNDIPLLLCQVCPLKGEAHENALLVKWHDLEEIVCFFQLCLYPHLDLLPGHPSGWEVHSHPLYQVQITNFIISSHSHPLYQVPQMASKISSSQTIPIPYTYTRYQKWLHKFNHRKAFPSLITGTKNGFKNFIISSH